MHVALTLQYFPDNDDAVVVHVSANPGLLHSFREVVLHEARERRLAMVGDPVAALVAEAEERCLHAKLAILLPEEERRRSDLKQVRASSVYTTRRPTPLGSSSRRACGGSPRFG